MAIEPRRGCGYRKVGGLYMLGGGLMEPCHRLPYPLSVCPTCKSGIKQTRTWLWVDANLFRPDCMNEKEQIVETTLEAMNRETSHCRRCVFCNTELSKHQDGTYRYGLLWVGTRFYTTPDDFSNEAERLGVCKRIQAVPRGLELGRTRVCLAHPRAVTKLVATWSLPDGTSIKCDDCGGSGFHEKTEEPCESCWRDEWKQPRTCNKVREEHPGVFRVFTPDRLELLLKKSDVTPERIAQEAKRGVTIVEVPDDDPDHQGTVYERESDFTE